MFSIFYQKSKRFVAKNSYSILALFLQFSGVALDAYDIINLVVGILTTLGIVALTVISVNHVRWNWRINRDKLFLSRKTLEKAERKQKQFAFITDDYVTENPILRYLICKSALNGHNYLLAS